MDGLLSGHPPVLSPDRGHLLWDNGSGTAAVWRLGADGPAEASRRQFGPFAGWAACALAVGPNGLVSLLWTGPGQAASLWSVDMKAGAVRHREFGPYTGWEARALAVGRDNMAHMLWTREDGLASVWLVGADGRVQSAEYGPYDGWSAVGVAAAAPVGASRLLWRGSGGAASLWDVGVRAGEEARRG